MHNYFLIIAYNYLCLSLNNQNTAIAIALDPLILRDISVCNEKFYFFSIKLDNIAFLVSKYTFCSKSYVRL